MRTNKLNLSTQTLARTSGFFYLLIITAGLMSALLVRERFIDASLPETSLNNLLQHTPLFRLSFLGELIMVISDASLAVLLYWLFKNEQRTLAFFALVFLLLQTAVLAVNLNQLFKPFLLIQGADELAPAAFIDLSKAVVLQFQFFEFGYLVSGVFFAINCWLMGLIVYRSALFPKSIGILLVAAGWGYLLNCLANFLTPAWVEWSEILLFVTAVVAEITFCLYLLINGTRTKA